MHFPIPKANTSRCNETTDCRIGNSTCPCLSPSDPNHGKESSRTSILIAAKPTCSCVNTLSPRKHKGQIFGGKTGVDGTESVTEGPGP